MLEGTAYYTVGIRVHMDELDGSIRVLKKFVRESVVVSHYRHLITALGMRAIVVVVRVNMVISLLEAACEMLSGRDRR